MITILPLALLGMLITAVASTPFHPKRQEDGQPVILRSDLKQGQGQSPEFKDLFLTHTPTNITGHYDITFVSRAEKANADHATIESRGIPLGLGNLTLYMNMGTDKGSPTGKQPVTLGPKQQSAGWFYAVGGELKSASSTPQWDTWIICDGEAGYPKLWWVGVVDLTVQIPEGCSAVRLFADAV